MGTRERLIELIRKLKARNNKAHEFFENLLIESGEAELSDAAKERLSSCYAITQYANFNDEEEKILSDIIENLNH